MDDLRPAPVRRPHPRRWLVLTVPAPARGEEHLLVDALRRLGAHAIEREGERFVAFLAAVDDPERTVRKARLVVRASTTLADPAVDWRWQEQDHWLEQRQAGGEALRVSDRIVVAPAAHPVQPRADDILVRLVPGVAFGTAEHPTTRTCLRFLDRAVTPGCRVADVGTGSGVLAVAAALLGAHEVLAVEADPLACEAAEANITLNRVGERVAVRCARVGPRGVAALGRFDGIVANIEAGVLQPLVPALASSLAAGGWLILSGVIRPERDALVRAAAETDLELVGEAIEDGWWTGSFRPSAPGRLNRRS